MMVIHQIRQGRAGKNQKLAPERSASSAPLAAGSITAGEIALPHPQLLAATLSLRRRSHAIRLIQGATLVSLVTSPLCATVALGQGGSCCA